MRIATVVEFLSVVAVCAGCESAIPTAAAPANCGSAGTGSGVRWQLVDGRKAEIVCFSPMTDCLPGKM